MWVAFPDEDVAGLPRGALEVVYGVAPAGFTDATVPRPLQPGAIYEVLALTRPMALGFFEVKPDGSITEYSLTEALALCTPP